MHISVKLDSPCELINIKPLNPLISKCQIKVCYVGEDPNRNRSVITKDVARDLANSLPGSPIVGYFNEATGDFEEHNRSIDISNNKWVIKDTTRPYGFVDLNAKVWFQKFLDDGIEHEYLMTEGWLWTGQYPECQRILDKGNNQSMELDEQLINAHWTKDKNGKPQFFIINEAIISKLCILGEDCEPCFEGAQISKVQFSFEDDFKAQLFSMMNEIKNILNEGGASNMGEETVVVTEETVEDATLPVEEPAVETPVTEEEVPAVVEEEPAVEYKADDDKKEEDKEGKEEKCPECGKPKDECTCEEDKKAQYNLDEIPEYVELANKYSALEGDYNTVVAEKEAMNNELAELRIFKANAERKDKEAMINQFYMLSDEDKADVVANIDTYSLDDIEAKLSIICVRNKVSFDLEEDNQDNGTDPVTYNLTGDMIEDTSVPAWVKAAMAVAKDMN